MPLPQAQIVHHIKGRVRLRVAELRNNKEYFTQIAEKLSSLGTLSSYKVNPASGCIVLQYSEPDWNAVAEQLNALSLFEITEEGPVETTPAMQPLISGIGRLDKLISERSTGQLDLRTVGYLVLIVLAIRQILQGQILGPGIPLLLHAWSLADRFRAEQRERERS